MGLKLGLDVDSIQEAIDVMQELVPGEETANDSRILRAVVTLNHLKCSLKKQLDDLQREQNQEQVK